MTEQQGTKPPRVLGILITIMGAALMAAGINFITRGDSPYFLVIGIGIVASGILMALGKRLGVYAYGLSLLVILVWSIIEEGMDISALLPRVAVPILLGVYVFSKKITGRLT
jgi:quinoprotein glucose dehydrogenase